MPAGVDAASDLIQAVDAILSDEWHCLSLG